jgi:hypothetical protein
MARLGRYFLSAQPPDQPLHVIERGNNLAPRLMIRAIF